MQRVSRGGAEFAEEGHAALFRFSALSAALRESFSKMNLRFALTGFGHGSGRAILANNLLTNLARGGCHDMRDDAIAPEPDAHCDKQKTARLTREMRLYAR